MPHVISESGRALTAHHALLLLKVIDVESQAEPAVPELTDDDHPLLHDMAGGLPRAELKPGVRGAPRGGGVSRRDVRQGARAGAVQQRRAHAARPRGGGADLLSRSSTRWRASTARDPERYEEIRPTSRPRSSTGTSATSRCSSRCPTAGRSISSSRSCRSIAWLRSRRGAARCRTSRATPTARSITSSGRGRGAAPSLRLHPYRRWRGVHPRHLPDRRVSGDPGRPAQPVRRHERGARAPHRRPATRSPTSCTATR